MRPFLVVPILMIGVAGCLSSQANGTIEARVVDEGGSALSFATVKLLGLNPTHLLHRDDRTDENGEAILAHIPWGSYMVCVGKEEDNYPDTLAALYVNAPVPIVTIAPASPTRSVLVKVGPRAGMLNPISISNAVTGKKVRAASVTLRRVDNGAFRTGSAQDSAFVPSLTKVFVEVHAPGYADWFYPGYADAAKAIPIVLRPGEVLPMNVSPEPLIQ